MDVYKSPVGQPKLEFKDIPFEFISAPNKRWVRLADLVPWEELELLSGYRNHFGSTGKLALPVQARLHLTDEETVEQVCENPYIQYFLGFEGYRPEKRPFDPSMMVNFRKRLDAETLKALDLCIFECRRETEEAAKKEEKSASEAGGNSTRVDGNDEETPPSGSPETPFGEGTMSPLRKESPIPPL